MGYLWVGDIKDERVTPLEENIELESGETSS